MTNPYFAPSFLLLQQEGYLCRSTLLMGLNALVTAHPGEKGFYYAGFLQLSVGIERMLKLALICDHMAQHELAAPSEQLLRGYGHDLMRLFAKARDLSDGETLAEVQALSAVEYEMRILRFLSEYAKITRYYNLNRLAARQPMADPLADWQRLLEALLETYGNNARIARLRGRAATFARAVEPHTIIAAHSLDHTPQAAFDWFAKPAEFQEATRYAIWHIYRLLQVLKGMLSDAAHRAQEVERRVGDDRMHIPVMYEFFYFLCLDRRRVIRKRRWP